MAIERTGWWKFDVARMMNLLKTEGPDYYTVWTLLLSNARREPGTVKTKAGDLEMERGDVLLSYRGMADLIGSNKDRVRRIVEHMCATGATQMRHQVRHHFSVVTITDYESWAGGDGEFAPPLAPPMRHRRDSSITKHVIANTEASKSPKSLDSSNSLPDSPLPFDQEKAFEEVWAQYPNRVGKKAALKHFKATVHNPDDFLRILDALRKYVNHIRTERKEKYVKNGSTWFNEWTDWLTWESPRLAIRPDAEPETDWDAIVFGTGTGGVQ